MKERERIKLRRKWIEADKNKCTGCRMCEVYCSLKHNKQIANPYESRIRIKKNEITGQDVPNICRQCKGAPCAKACPVDAILFNDITGAWVVNYEECTGCGLCVKACPFGSIYLDVSGKVALKCDLCGGEIPACVDICPVDALRLAGKGDTE